MATRKRILVSPLDWGLGHATRCVPLINGLVDNGCDVILAGSGDSLLVLRKQFPFLSSFELPGYNVRYSYVSSQMVPLMFQLPRLTRVIAAEHTLISQKVKQEKIDGIISDNRYGVYSDSVPSVLITHQLKLMLPRSLQWSGMIVQTLLHRYINRFDECWVPDMSGDENLSGALSHNVDLKIPVSFIGPLSRLEKPERLVRRTPLGGGKYDILVLLSGPEPQRTLLEEKVTQQLVDTKLRVVMIRGLPRHEKMKSLRDGFDVISYADADELQRLISESNVVLARSGYSSVMDLSRMNANALLVPTPGQPEQEYLANYLSQKQQCTTSSQRDLNIVTLLENMKRPVRKDSFGGGFPQNFNYNLHCDVIKQWLQTI